MINGMADFDALVLAGGSGRRLGGVDKAGLELGTQTLLERALAAVAGAGGVVVVGPERLLPPGVVQTCEDPPGGGPVAAVEAGLALVTQPTVVIVACDMPLLTQVDVRRLIDVLASDLEADAAMYIDEGGRRQPLAAAYRVRALHEAIGSVAPTSGRSVRDLIGPLTVVEIAADPGTTADVDTWADMARSRALLEDR